MAGLVGASFWADETLEAVPQNVNTNSKPSELKITDMRVASAEREGRAPGPDASILKIKGTEVQQALTELMMEATDPAASDELAVAIRKRYMSMRKTTIYAGSNEIQRNIIAKMTLGL